ncbi:hypothetical protein RCIP0023_00397 [Klebsiella phage RCIP0023]
MIAIWFIMVILVGVWANAWGRSGILFGLLSLILSPLIGAIVLLCAGKKVVATQPQNMQPIQNIVIHTNGTTPSEVQVTTDTTVLEKEDESDKKKDQSLEPVEATEVSEIVNEVVESSPKEDNTNPVPVTKQKRAQQAKKARTVKKKSSTVGATKQTKTTKTVVDDSSTKNTSNNNDSINSTSIVPGVAAAVITTQILTESSSVDSSSSYDSGSCDSSSSSSCD